MTLVTNSLHKLEEIKKLLEQIPFDLFIQPKEIISNSTVGQHYRHIIEFYICFTKGFEKGLICYDERKRDKRLETDINYIFSEIDKIKTVIEKINQDDDLKIKANYSSTCDESILIKTSIYRELAYVLDHTIHHIAIIKIALAEDKLELDSSLGVAPSTLMYQKTCAQ